MNALEDPRVTPSVGVSDEAYDIATPDGVWDVVLDLANGFVAVPPNHPDGDFTAWLTSLPHFATAEEAVASVLARY